MVTVTWRRFDQSAKQLIVGHTGAAKGGGAGARPKLGSQKNSWLCRWAKYTKLCMVWQPNILNNCYELSGGCTPEPPTRGSAPGPRWGTSVPQTPCAPTSKSWLRHWLVIRQYTDDALAILSPWCLIIYCKHNRVNVPLNLCWSIVSIIYVMHAETLKGWSCDLISNSWSLQIWKSVRDEHYPQSRILKNLERGPTSLKIQNVIVYFCRFTEVVWNYRFSDNNSQNNSSELFDKWD